MTARATLPVTVVVAVRNEEINIRKCLTALGPARRVIVADSHSTDRTAAVATELGAEVVQFRYTGGYPKKRQWVLDTVPIATEWVLFLDADEEVPPALWDEIRAAVADPQAPNGFLIVKGFHFLGRRFRFGGFSFAAVLLVRLGRARFERLVDDATTALDMEVHERVIVDGAVGTLRTPLIHDDFKGLNAYLDRHNKYSTWEAKLRHTFLTTGRYGDAPIAPRLFGNAQERRRFLKRWVLRLPCESLIWFAYHYFVRLGFLEGRPGLVASRIRADYIAAVRAKMYELQRQVDSK
ncbi:Glycosyl transferase family 2 [Gemmata obscuriglobus]|uniref:Glycosyltransferase family 2 protein n=1 Tax=Gemmata obscuriglobus TaxID=114 RepID=A0A2Z3H6T5_9BACT|nr:glycosyltransferase family 2 protein [Gemmata obscuriglobus]AWM40072.1 glycosyltransferase family 2 protein [Gemmata obscuriglobus]QEG26765.1 Glycosyl transferase family 2 [Gemmata obscuriglobus]VTS02585.1 Glycosyl transferase, group 2 family protein OS=Methylococcus capsulatus (strain ATCC 33009 / NCIMB 11132 / Bath) GN=MCA1166 PE=4 SV=1: Glycos_transf_2 [Gemmata obscuriglobus UQM 2246]